MSAFGGKADIAISKRQDIVVWLRSLGLGQYEAAFRDTAPLSAALTIKMNVPDVPTYTAKEIDGLYAAPKKVRRATGRGG